VKLSRRGQVNGSGQFAATDSNGPGYGLGR
jgi:hypothetical protein